MESNILSPSIDRRLSELIDRDRRPPAPVQTKKPLTLCLSRKYGCEAYPLAEILEARLEERTQQNWLILDKVLLDKIAEDRGLSKQILESIGNSPTYIDLLLAPLMKNWVSASQAFRLILQYILRFAEEGNTIIIGRGGSIITQDKANCFHFRLDAPLSFRVESIARRLNLPLDEAHDMVVKNEKKREEFVNAYFHRDVTDVSLYHSVYNNAKSPIENIADSILALLEPHL
jgi:hypothetical protein